jgi:hypothetical protein
MTLRIAFKHPATSTEEVPLIVSHIAGNFIRAILNALSVLRLWTS